MSLLGDEDHQPDTTTPPKHERLRITCIDCGTPIPPKKHKKRCQACWAKFSKHVYIAKDMLISEWSTDERGHMCRTITGA